MARSWAGASNVSTICPSGRELAAGGAARKQSRRSKLLWPSKLIHSKA
jgi:hypothetical protein